MALTFTCLEYIVKHLHICSGHLVMSQHVLWHPPNRLRISQEGRYWNSQSPPGEIFEWHLHVSESLTPRRPSWGNRGVWRNIPVLSLPSLICRRCWQEAWAAGGERSHCPQLNQFTIRSEPPSSPLRWTRTGSGSADDCKKKKEKKKGSNQQITRVLSSGFEMFPAQTGFGVGGDG